jgi:putative membrane protein
MWWWWNDNAWSDHYWAMPWIIGPVMMLLFFLVCASLMFFMMRRHGMCGPRRSEALEILKQRFARGEINQAEYEDRRRFLGV